MATIRLSLVGFGAKLAILAVLVVNTLALARFLGPEGYGTYFIFIRVISVLAIFADLGLSQSANAFVGRYEHWIGRINTILLSLACAFSLGSMLLGAALYALAGEQLLPGFSWKWMGMAFVVLPFALYGSFWNSAMVGLGRIWILNLVRLGGSILSLILTIIFVVQLAGDAETAAATYIAAMAAQFVVMSVIVFRLSHIQTNNEAPANLRWQMLHFGLRGHSGAILYILWTQLPAFALNAIHGPVAVGVFSVAQQLVEKALLPVQAFQDVVYKKMSMLSREAATRTMTRYIRVVAWGMSIVALTGIVLAPWAFNWLLGPAYAGAGQVSRLLFLGTVVMSLSMLLDTYFLNQLHRPGLVSVLAGINLIICLILVVLFVPSLAQMGAAWALVITQILGTALMYYLYLRISRTQISRQEAGEPRLDLG